MLLPAHVSRPIVLTLAGITLSAFLAAPPLYAAVDTSSQFGVQVERYEEAQASFDAGNYEAAVIHLKNLLTERPDYLPARLLLGRAHLKAGRPAAAVKELLLARKSGADEHLVRVPLASAYLLARQYPEALQEARRVDAPESERVELLVLEGDALLAMERPEEAQESFLRAASLAPADPGPQIGQARVHLVRKQLPAAAAAATRAVRLAPDSVAGWHMLGEIKRAGGDANGALEAYNRVLALAPEHVQALLGRAAIHFHNDDQDAALADVQTVYTHVSEQPQAMYIEALIRARGDDTTAARALLDSVTSAMAGTGELPKDVRGEVQLLAGAANFALGNLEQARSHLDAFIAIHPRHLGALKLLGNVEWRQGNPTRALQLLGDAIALAPSDVSLRLQIGRIQIASGNPRRALTTLQEAQRIAPEDSQVHVALARARLALGDRRKALTDLEQAISLETADVATVFLLGVEYLKSGRLEDARQASEVLMRREPEHPTSHNLAGLAALAMKDREAAREHFARSIALDPEYLPATNNLAQMDLEDERPDAARARYQALRDRTPGNVHVLREMGRIAVKTESYKEAMSLLQEANRAAPEDMATQLLMIDVALRSDRTDEALSLALNAERQQPTNLAVLMTLARTHLALEAAQDAAKVLTRAAVEAANSGARLHAVALLQLAADDETGAYVSLKRAVRLSPKMMAAHTRLVALELKRMGAAKALERVRWARKMNPDNPLAPLLEGDLLVRMRLYSVALEAFEASRDAGGMNSALAVRFFNARLKAQKAEEAVTGLEDWLAEHPDDVIARRTLATHYLNAGRIEPAIAHHETLMVQQPGDAQVSNNLAWLYHQNGDPRALERAEAAHRMSPDEPAVLDTIGWILVQQGEAARGVFYLREAQSRATQDLAIRFHLAVGLHRIGRSDEALRELDRLLASGEIFDGIEDARNLHAKLTKQ